MTQICVYCGEEKGDGEFSLEHAIPQFLGGAYAPDAFKTHDVCERCNNNLGLFVDAAFEKSWFVSNWLQMTARVCLDPQNPSSLPLICMGNSSLWPPGMTNDEVCESWLGPLGEQIYWIRPKDENLYWYVGGNPRTTKTSESRAYFHFSERSLKHPKIVWYTFRDAFSNRKKVKKIMCAEVHGADPMEIGFSVPDDTDVKRIRFFSDIPAMVNGDMKNQLSININYDQRFMAKLGLGIGYCLFGKKAIDSVYGKELRKGLWHQEKNTEDDENSLPMVRGCSAWGHQQDKIFTNLVGTEYAVSLIIMPSKDGVAVNLNIGKNLSWTVMCASYEGIDKSDLVPWGWESNFAI